MLRFYPILHFCCSLENQELKLMTTGWWRWGKICVLLRDLGSLQYYWIQSFLYQTECILYCRFLPSFLLLQDYRRISEGFEITQPLLLLSIGQTFSEVNLLIKSWHFNFWGFFFQCSCSLLKWELSTAYPYKQATGYFSYILRACHDKLCRDY